ncbi:hypothetical protein DFH06DRAFT_1146761 [Mycena polygramma]|nr:hypothetical protein DFH06DRAFT_1146761 [Mycena polygramma]
MSAEGVQHVGEGSAMKRLRREERRWRTRDANKRAERRTSGTAALLCNHIIEWMLRSLRARGIRSTGLVVAHPSQRGGHESQAKGLTPGVGGACLIRSFMRKNGRGGQTLVVQRRAAKIWCQWWWKERAKRSRGIEDKKFPYGDREGGPVRA